MVKSIKYSLQNLHLKFKVLTLYCFYAPCLTFKLIFNFQALKNTVLKNINNYKAIWTTTTLLLQLYLTYTAIWHGKASLDGKMRNERINLSRREKLIYNWLVRNRNMKSQHLTNFKRPLPNKSTRDTDLLLLNKETIQ